MACIKIYHANFSLHKKGKKGGWKILSGSLNGRCCKGTTGESEGVVKYAEEQKEAIIRQN